MAAALIPSQVLSATTPAASTNIDLNEIASRWKFRPTVVGSSSCLPPEVAAYVTPPPDIRSEFLKLRADLLRREPLISQTSSIENELAATLDKVRILEAETKDLRQQLVELHGTFDEVNRQREKQNEVIQKLQHELLDAKRQVEEERAARTSTMPSSQRMNSGSLLSPQGSLSGGLTSPQAVVIPVRSVHLQHNPRTVVRASSPSSSVKATSSSTTTARSPARAR